MHEGVVAPVITVSVHGPPAALPPELLADPEAEARDPEGPPVVDLPEEVQPLVALLVLNCRPAQSSAVTETIEIQFRHDGV